MGAAIPALLLLSRYWAPSRLSSLRCGKLQSFFSDAIAPNTFLRKVLLTITVSSSAWQRTRADADLSSANSSPSGHSTQSVVLLAWAIAGPDRRIQVFSRVGPNGRDLKLPQGNSDRTTGPPFGSFNLLSVLSDMPAGAGGYNTFGL